MIIGYARASTTEQHAGLDAQRPNLIGAGCEKVFHEQVSSVAHRDELVRCMDYVREGDTLIVCKPDRLARSVSDLLTIVAKLEHKQVSLVILSMGGQRVDLASPTGRLMLTMLGAVAEFERALMLERQREGIAAAKQQGKYKGRAPTARAKAADVIALDAEGPKRDDIAARLNIGVASMYRVLASHRAVAP